MEHKQVPHTDVFSYTYAGTPWVNIKWGSEVIAAIIDRTFGPECIFLLQALVCCTLVFLLLKTAQLFSLQSNKDISSVAYSLAFVFLLFACEYRFNGRPEMFSHLFAVVFLFVLLKYRNQNSNKIFWLVPLQIMWANLHEAFGMGIVLVAIFCAGAWAEYLFTQKGKLNIRKEKPLKISLLLIALVASVIINPNGIELLTRPLNILGQVYENKFTTELAGISSTNFWQWNTYLAIAILLVGVSGTALYFRQQKTKNSKWNLFVAHFGIGYLLTIPAYIYLAVTAYRNIIFLLLIFFPVFAFALSYLFSKVKALQKNLQAVLITISATILIAYGLVVSNKYYTLTQSHDSFGLQVIATYNPVGAADYAISHKLRGPCFSDYLTSSYLLYKVNGFKTFIDLRDLDVFPSAFFNTFAEAVTFPEEFQKLDSSYHFNYIVLYRPQFTRLHSYLYNESRFHLAYADPVACVFIPKSGQADSALPPFTPNAHLTRSVIANVVNHVLNPFFKSDDNIDEADYLAATYFTGLGDFNAAEIYAVKAANLKSTAYKGNEALGEIAYNVALAQNQKPVRDSLLQLSYSYYTQSIAQQNDFSPAYLGLGAVYFQSQDMQQALQSFNKAIQLDAENLNACIFAGECCKFFINQNTDAENYTEKAIGYYKKADHLNPDNPDIQLNLGFLYFRQNNCAAVNRYLKNLEDYEGLSPQDRQQVKSCLQRCNQ